MEPKQHLLAAQLRHGDRQAAAQLVDIYYRPIYLFFRRLGHSRPTSEDLTQETFLQAWQHLGQLRDAEALTTWLYHIAANASKMYWRRRKGAKAVDAEQLELTAAGTGDNPAAQLEVLRVVDRAVANLPFKLRQAVVLHYMQRLSIGEAAEAAGVGKGTLKSRLNRALEMLRKEIDSEVG